MNNLIEFPSQDASHIFQPGGPTVTDVTPTSPQQHIDINAIRHQVLNTLQECLNDLASTKDQFAEYKASLGPDIEEQRKSWYRSKPEDTGRGEQQRWKDADPEVQALDAVREAKKKVEQARVQLSEAESQLAHLQSQGSPRAKYVTALHRATSMCNAASAQMERVTVEDIIHGTYGTTDLATVPLQAISNARIHPQVIRFQRQRITGLDPSRDAYGDLELSAANSRIIAGANNLIAVLKGK